jgi:hypothetical protein
VAFADETDHYARRFSCSWLARAETAEDVARRIRAMAQGLNKIATGYGDLWPLLGMRAVRSGDPGPIPAMKVADLATWIDTRCRFDPPRPPAPVAASGFSLALGTLRGDPLDRPHGANIRVGVSHAGEDNRVQLGFWNEAPIWRDQDQALAVLYLLADAWDAEVAAAWAFATSSVDDLTDGDTLDSHERPWLAWTRAPLKPRPIVAPYFSPFPYPFPFEEAGPPLQVLADGDSKLEIWP